MIYFMVVVEVVVVVVLESEGLCVSLFGLGYFFFLLFCED